MSGVARAKPKNVTTDQHTFLASAHETAAAHGSATGRPWDRRRKWSRRNPWDRRRRWDRRPWCRRPNGFFAAVHAARRPHTPDGRPNHSHARRRQHVSPAMACLRCGILGQRARRNKGALGRAPPRSDRRPPRDRTISTTQRQTARQEKGGVQNEGCVCHSHWARDFNHHHKASTAAPQREPLPPSW